MTTKFKHIQIKSNEFNNKKRNQRQQDELIPSNLATSKIMEKLGVKNKKNDKNSKTNKSLVLDEKKVKKMNKEIEDEISRPTRYNSQAKRNVNKNEDIEKPKKKTSYSYEKRNNSHAKKNNKNAKKTKEKDNDTVTLKQKNKTEKTKKGKKKSINKKEKENDDEEDDDNENNVKFKKLYKLPKKGQQKEEIKDSTKRGTKKKNTVNDKKDGKNVTFDIKNGKETKAKNGKNSSVSNKEKNGKITKKKSKKVDEDNDEEDEEEKKGEKRKKVAGKSVDKANNKKVNKNYMKAKTIQTKKNFKKKEKSVSSSSSSSSSGSDSDSGNESDSKSSKSKSSKSDNKSSKKSESSSKTSITPTPSSSLNNSEDEDEKEKDNKKDNMPKVLNKSKTNNIEKTNSNIEEKNKNQQNGEKKNTKPEEQQILNNVPKLENIKPPANDGRKGSIILGSTYLRRRSMDNPFTRERLELLVNQMTLKQNGGNTLFLKNYENGPSYSKEITIITKDNQSIKKNLKINECTKAGCSGPGIVKTNQDAYFVKENFLKNNEYFFIGVCDGHGEQGHVVSNFVTSKLPSYITELNNENITNAFKKVNKEIYANSKMDSNMSGTTVVSIVLTPNNILCVNLGDSRAALFKYDNGIYYCKNLSRDHKPCEADESRRIINNGGRVKKCYDEEHKRYIGPDRVWLKNKEEPGLAMTRSLGDKIAHNIGVIDEPEFKTFTFDGTEKFIIIASDGLWEYVSGDQCISIVRPFYEDGKDSKEAALALTKEAFRKWKRKEVAIDDITVVVIFFD